MMGLHLTIMTQFQTNPFNCPKGYVFSVLYSVLFFFSFLTRCVSPLVSPSAGPHDSFSTDILRGPKLSPPPCLFSSSHSLFLWAQTPTAGLSQPALLVSNSGGTRTQQREGMKLMWNIHSQRVGALRIFTLSFSPPLVVTGGGGTSLPRCCYGCWWVDPLDDTLREVNTPPVWGEV